MRISWQRYVVTGFCALMLAGLAGCRHSEAEGTHEHEHEEEAEHAHEGEGTHEHEDLVLSPQALLNSGITDRTQAKVAVTSFGKTLSIPGMVVERTGFTTMTVASPTDGTVTKIHHEVGTSVAPGGILFEISLTSPSVVQAQNEFLTLLQQRDTLAEESARLQSIAQDLVPQEARSVRFQTRENQTALENQRNLLRSQGLSESDIAETLEKNRKIVRVLNVRAPEVESSETLQIRTLDVEAGQRIEIGQPLCQLEDMRVLRVEGQAFAVNEPLLREARKRGSAVSVTFEGTGTEPEVVTELKLRNLGTRIDPKSRTLPVFVDLENEIVESDGPFAVWRYRPGQRCTLDVEFETIENCIVLPVGAVARDVNDFCVFELEEVAEDGDLVWVRRPVHVLHQTRTEIVLANDGSLAPGATVAARGASFLQTAYNARLNNSAGAVDPHAGHAH